MKEQLPELFSPVQAQRAPLRPDFSDARAPSVRQSFEDSLTEVDSLEGFVQLLSEQPPGFFTWLYRQQPQQQGQGGTSVFELIAQVFRDIALPQVDEGDQERGSQSFKQLMDALPVFAITDPLVRPSVTFDLFDVVKTDTIESCYIPIFDKWLALWPVQALSLPTKFSLWLSGNLLGAQTSQEDLKSKRRLALQTIYDAWLGIRKPETYGKSPEEGESSGEGEGAESEAPEESTTAEEMRTPLQPISVSGYADFVALLRLVPIEFWYWQDQDRAGGPMALEPDEVREYLEKRKLVWGRIHAAWQGIRARNTGWVDFPFSQAWTLANQDLTWPNVEGMEAGYPDAARGLERFRRSRRGRIWA